MRTIRVYILGAIALLIIGAQLTLIASRATSTTGTGMASVSMQAVGAPTLQASPIVVALTPVATPMSSPVESGDSTPAVPTGPSDDTPFFAPPVGVPAIQPSLKNAGPGTPAITMADVMRYHSTTNIHGIAG